MEIKLLTHDDIKEVALLHKKMLPFTQSSKIGIKFLQVLYRKAVLEPEFLSYCVKDGDRIIAVITATANLEKSQDILTPRIVFLIAEAILRGKVSIGELTRRILLGRALIKKFPSTYATILTLFVARGYQRHGIGKKLVQKILRNIHANNGLYVDTLVKNKSAQKFYQSAGFVSKAKVLDSVVMLHAGK